MKAAIYDQQGLLGTISYDGQALTASTPGLQRVADDLADRKGAAEAWQTLSTIDNGYVRADLTPD